MGEFYSVLLQNRTNGTSLQTIGTWLHILFAYLCRKEINREEEYETNDSFIIISAGCIVYVRTDNFGRVSAENAGQLSVSEAVWSYRKN